MLEFTTTDKAPAVEREDFFSLDGKVYTIPVRFTAADALVYADWLRKWGPDMAASWALEYALGTEGYQALLSADEDTVPRAEFIRLLHIITARLQGRESPVPGPKAPKPATTPKRAPRGSKGTTSKQG